MPAWARLAGPGAGACRRCVGGGAALSPRPCCVTRAPSSPVPPRCVPHRIPQGCSRPPSHWWGTLSATHRRHCCRCHCRGRVLTCVWLGEGGGGGLLPRNRVRWLQPAPGCPRWRVAAPDSLFCSFFSVPGFSVSVTLCGGGHHCPAARGAQFVMIGSRPLACDCWRLRAPALCCPRALRWRGWALRRRRPPTVERHRR